MIALAIAEPSPGRHKTPSRRSKPVAIRRNPVTQPVTPELLRTVGEAAYGPQWFSPMARVLSEHHPDGGDLHAVVVRNWATGARSIPEWVSRALVLAAISEIERLEVLRRELLERQARVDQAVSLLLDRGASSVPATPAAEASFDVTVKAWISRRQGGDV